MYPVSDAYLEASRQHTVATKWTGMLTTLDGAVYEITPSLIEAGSGKLTRQICPSKDLVIGGTCASQLDIKLKLADVSRYTLMHAKLTMSHALQLADGSWESVPLGEFEVTEPPERKRSTITLHAYDNMQRFNGSFDGTVIGKPYEILLNACGTCGVGLGTTQDEIANYPNGDLETWNLAGITIYTWRDLIGHVASLLCCYAYCGPDGRLYVEPYRMTADRSIPPSRRFEYTPTDYECYYTSITHYFHTTQEYESVSLAAGGLDYDLGENPFIQFNIEEERHAALTAIISKLSELRYTPFTAKMPSDPSIMPGDVLEFTGNHAVEGKLAAVTKQVITLHGGMTIECGGDDPNLNVLTDQEKRIRTAAQNSNKDSVFYYDFHNVTEITLEDGDRARIIVFHYITTRRTHVDFHAELKCQVETTETYDEESRTYTEHDGVVELTYLQSGYEVTEYYPVELLCDGTQLMHLIYAWNAEANVIGTFEVLMRCRGCSVTIAEGAARGYLAGPGLAGEAGWDGTVYVYDEFEPVDFGRIHGRFTGEAVPTLGTPDQAAVTDRLPRHNFLRTLTKPFQAKVGASGLHRFSVPYNDDEMEKTDVQTVGSVWANAAADTDGTVTTPSCAVDRIVKVTSAHTDNTGDVTYLASFDDGETWYSYAGGSWALHDSGYGMVEGVLSAITEPEWAAMIQGGTVKIRAIIRGDATLADIQIFTVIYQEEK